jgi:hypothetical protein
MCLPYREVGAEMNKHTPGPWRWFNGCSWWRLGNGLCDGGEVIRPTVARDGWPDLVVSDADKRLIAAAPELLEAAKTFIAWVDDVWGSAALSPKTLAEYEKAKLAIAKAEAGSEGK